MAATYRIEAVVDGTWHWYAGRQPGGPLSGMSVWSTTDDKAVTFTSKREATKEQARLGGTTFLRKVVR